VAKLIMNAFILINLGRCGSATALEDKRW